MVGFISLADARLQVKAEDTSEDTLIAGFIAAAAAHAENITGFVCPKRTAEPVVLDRFPGNDRLHVQSQHHRHAHRRNEIVLKLRPVDPESIAISYIDGTGAIRAFTNFRVWEKDGLTRIGPAFGYCWPVAACLPGAVAITFDVGFDAATDDAPSAAPANVNNANRLLVAHWFRNREGVIAGTRAAAVEIPLGVDDLLELEHLPSV